MNPIQKLQVLAKSGPWEIGVLVVGLVYLEHNGKLHTENSPYDAMRKITDETHRQEIAKQIKGD